MSKAFEVVEARWGAGDKWVDATSAARDKFRHGPFVPVMFGNNDIDDDPAYGIVKELQVNFRFRGTNYQRTIGEDDWRPLITNRSRYLYATGCQDSPIHKTLMLDLVHSQEELKEAIVAAGLSPYSTYNYPEYMRENCGKGMHIWQYPCQFAPYLLEVVKRKPLSYLEIGSMHGGTFAYTVEYLTSMLGKMVRAVSVDKWRSAFLNAYQCLNPIVEVINGNSHGRKVKDAIFDLGPYDLALVDGDHSYNGCMEDFLFCMDMCRTIAVHDIVDDYEKGVGLAWKDIKEKHSSCFDFFEFKDQYAEVDKLWMGIGLAIKRD